MPATIDRPVRDATLDPPAPYDVDLSQENQEPDQPDQLGQLDELEDLARLATKAQDDLAAGRRAQLAAGRACLPDGHDPSATLADQITSRYPNQKQDIAHDKITDLVYHLALWTQIPTGAISDEAYINCTQRTHMANPAIDLANYFDTLHPFTLHYVFNATDCPYTKALLLQYVLDHGYIMLPTATMAADSLAATQKALLYSVILMGDDDMEEGPRTIAPRIECEYHSNNSKIIYHLSQGMSYRDAFQREHHGPLMPNTPTPARFLKYEHPRHRPYVPYVPPVRKKPATPADAAIAPTDS